MRSAPETVPDPRAPNVIQVIACELLRRGQGTPESPLRAVRQYFTLDGCLLAEVDPVNEELGILARQVMELATKNKELETANRHLVALVTCRKLAAERRKRPAKKGKRK
jgi:hypothetical protein